MPRNGSGNYSLPTNAWNPAINGVSATPADWQALINDVAAAIQASVSADGQTPVTGPLNLGGNRLRNVGAPQGSGDALRFEQMIKGPDVSSAPTIAFPVEGSLFDVTGTTTITGIAASFPGRTVLVRFKGALTLTNGTNLILPAVANITTHVDDLATFICLDGTVWKCMLYTNTSPTDTTPGRVLKVGDGGFLGVSVPLPAPGADLAMLAYASGVTYTLSGTIANSPLSGSDGILEVANRQFPGVAGITLTATYASGDEPRVFKCQVAATATSGLYTPSGPLTWVELYHSGNLSSDLQWLGTPIGGYITPFSPPPTNDSRFRYVLCTAGQTGTGGYNAGALTGETVTGTSPLISATAVVSLAGSPMNGGTIHLINTERRFVGADAAEGYENDALQNITGTIGGLYQFSGGSSPTGALSSGGKANASVGSGTTATVFTDVNFSTANSPGARVSDHTQPRTHRLLHYRRIL